MPFEPSTAIKLSLEIPVERMKFSGGEIQVRLGTRPYCYQDATTIGITAKLQSSDDVMELLLVTDALRRKYPTMQLWLTMPYLPYARQDRVCAQGEALSLKVFCDLINAQKYNRVFIVDCHSDVGAALLDNCENQSSEVYVKKVTQYFLKGKRVVLVSPDAGANKKVQGLSTALQIPFVRADKTRDTKTGAITGCVVYTEKTSDDYLIIDDICDGGRTFVELAKVLREKTTGKIHLYVTHGIFSAGYEVFDEYIDTVYTPFPFKPLRANNEEMKGYQTQFIKL